MADFEAAFDETLGHEGGYVHDPDGPDDAGGATYRGVARVCPGSCSPAARFGGAALAVAR